MTKNSYVAEVTFKLPVAKNCIRPESVPLNISVLGSQKVISDFLVYSWITFTSVPGNLGFYNLIPVYIPVNQM